MDLSFAGLKVAAPKVVSGMWLGLPLTVAIGPGLGLVILGVLGAACVGGYVAATKVKSREDVAVSAVAPGV